MLDMGLLVASAASPSASQGFCPCRPGSRRVLRASLTSRSLRSTGPPRGHRRYLGRRFGLQWAKSALAGSECDLSSSRAPLPVGSPTAQRYRPRSHGNPKVWSVAVKRACVEWLSLPVGKSRREDAARLTRAMRSTATTRSAQPRAYLRARHRELRSTMAGLNVALEAVLLHAGAWARGIR